MYKNIGKKISALALLVCILGIICSVCSGISFGLSYNTVNQPVEMDVVLPDGTVLPSTSGEVEYQPSSPVFHIIGGILIALAGSVFSWIGSFTMYGFGYLITKTTENSEYLKRMAGE